MEQLGKEGSAARAQPSRVSRFHYRTIDRCGADPDRRKLRRKERVPAVPPYRGMVVHGVVACGPAGP